MLNLTYCPTLLYTPSLAANVDRDDMFSWPDTHRLPLEPSTVCGTGGSRSGRGWYSTRHELDPEAICGADYGPAF